MQPRYIIIRITARGSVEFVDTSDHPSLTINDDYLYDSDASDKFVAIDRFTHMIRVYRVEAVKSLVEL